MTSDPAQDPADGGHEYPSFDTSVAHVARIYDYWLGGKDNFEADRVAGEATIAAITAAAFFRRARRHWHSGQFDRYAANWQEWTWPHGYRHKARCWRS